MTDTANRKIQDQIDAEEKFVNELIANCITMPSHRKYGDETMLRVDIILMRSMLNEWKGKSR